MIEFAAQLAQTLHDIRDYLRDLKEERRLARLRAAAAPMGSIAAAQALQPAAVPVYAGARPIRWWEMVLANRFGIPPAIASLPPSEALMLAREEGAVALTKSLAGGISVAATAAGILMGGPLGFGIALTAPLISSATSQRLNYLQQLRAMMAPVWMRVGLGRPSMHEAAQMSGVLREMARRSRIWSESDLREILKMLGTTDLLSGVQTATEFTASFRQLMKNLETITMAMYTNYKDALALMARLRGLGISPPYFGRLPYLARQAPGATPRQAVEEMEQPLREMVEAGWKPEAAAEYLMVMPTALLRGYEKWIGRWKVPLTEQEKRQILTRFAAFIANNDMAQTMLLGMLRQTSAGTWELAPEAFRLSPHELYMRGMELMWQIPQLQMREGRIRFLSDVIFRSPTSFWNAFQKIWQMQAEYYEMTGLKPEEAYKQAFTQLTGIKRYHVLNFFLELLKLPDEVVKRQEEIVQTYAKMQQQYEQLLANTRDWFRRGIFDFFKGIVDDFKKAYEETIGKFVTSRQVAGSFTRAFESGVGAYGTFAGGVSGYAAATVLSSPMFKEFLQAVGGRTPLSFETFVRATPREAIEKLAAQIQEQLGPEATQQEVSQAVRRALEQAYQNFRTYFRQQYGGMPTAELWYYFARNIKPEELTGFLSGTGNVPMLFETLARNLNVNVNQLSQTIGQYIPRALTREAFKAIVINELPPELSKELNLDKLYDALEREGITRDDIEALIREIKTAWQEERQRGYSPQDIIERIKRGEVGGVLGLAAGNPEELAQTYRKFLELRNLPDELKKALSEGLEKPIQAFENFNTYVSNFDSAVGLFDESVQRIVEAASDFKSAAEALKETKIDVTFTDDDLRRMATVFAQAVDEKLRPIWSALVSIGSGQMGLDYITKALGPLATERAEDIRGRILGLQEMYQLYGPRRFVYSVFAPFMRGVLRQIGSEELEREFTDMMRRFSTLSPQDFYSRTKELLDFVTRVAQQGRGRLTQEQLIQLAGYMGVFTAFPQTPNLWQSMLEVGAARALAVPPPETLQQRFEQIRERLFGEYYRRFFPTPEALAAGIPVLPRNASLRDRIMYELIQRRDLLASAEDFWQITTDAIIRVLTDAVKEKLGDRRLSELGAMEKRDLQLAIEKTLEALWKEFFGATLTETQKRMLSEEILLKVSSGQVPWWEKARDVLLGKVGYYLTFGKFRYESDWLRAQDRETMLRLMRQTLETGDYGTYSRLIRFFTARVQRRLYPLIGTGIGEFAGAKLEAGDIESAAKFIEYFFHQYAQLQEAVRQILQAKAGTPLYGVRRRLEDIAREAGIPTSELPALLAVGGIRASTLYSGEAISRLEVFRTQLPKLRERRNEIFAMLEDLMMLYNVSLYVRNRPLFALPTGLADRFLQAYFSMPEQEQRARIREAGQVAVLTSAAFPALLSPSEVMRRLASEGDLRSGVRTYYNFLKSVFEGTELMKKIDDIFAPFLTAQGEIRESDLQTIELQLKQLRFFNRSDWSRMLKDYADSIIKWMEGIVGLQKVSSEKIKTTTQDIEKESSEWQRTLESIKRRLDAMGAEIDSEGTKKSIEDAGKTVEDAIDSAKDVGKTGEKKTKEITDATKTAFEKVKGKADKAAEEISKEKGADVDVDKLVDDTSKTITTIKDTLGSAKELGETGEDIIGRYLNDAGSAFGMFDNTILQPAATDLLDTASRTDVPALVDAKDAVDAFVQTAKTIWEEAKKMVATFASRIRDFFAGAARSIKNFFTGKWLPAQEETEMAAKPSEKPSLKQMAIEYVQARIRGKEPTYSLEDIVTAAKTQPSGITKEFYQELRRTLWQKFIGETKGLVSQEYIDAINEVLASLKPLIGETPIKQEKKPPQSTEIQTPPLVAEAKPIAPSDTKDEFEKLVRLVEDTGKKVQADSEKIKTSADRAKQYMQKSAERFEEVKEASEEIAEHSSGLKEAAKKLEKATSATTSAAGALSKSLEHYSASTKKVLEQVKKSLEGAVGTIESGANSLAGAVSEIDRHINRIIRDLNRKIAEQTSASRGSTEVTVPTPPATAIGKAPVSLANLPTAIQTTLEQKAAQGSATVTGKFEFFIERVKNYLESAKKLQELLAQYKATPAEEVEKKINLQTEIEESIKKLQQQRDELSDMVAEINKASRAYAELLKMYGAFKPEEMKKIWQKYAEQMSQIGKRMNAYRRLWEEYRKQAANIASGTNWAQDVGFALNTLGIWPEWNIAVVGVKEYDTDLSKAVEHLQDLRKKASTLLRSDTYKDLAEQLRADIQNLDKLVDDVKKQFEAITEPEELEKRDISTIFALPGISRARYAMSEIEKQIEELRGLEKETQELETQLQLDRWRQALRTLEEAGVDTRAWQELIDETEGFINHLKEQINERVEYNKKLLQLIKDALKEYNKRYQELEEFRQKRLQELKQNSQQSRINTLAEKLAMLEEEELPLEEELEEMPDEMELSAMIEAMQASPQPIVQRERVYKPITKRLKQKWDQFKRKLESSYIQPEVVQTEVVPPQVDINLSTIQQTRKNIIYNLADVTPPIGAKSEAFEVREAIQQPPQQRITVPPSVEERALVDKLARSVERLERVSKELADAAYAFFGAYSAQKYSNFTSRG